MRASIYIKKKELEKYLDRKGYKLKSLRKIITDDFGYSSGKVFCNVFTNLSPSVLNIKVAYKSDDEYEIILIIVSSIIDFLNGLIKSSTRFFIGRDIIFRRFDMCGKDLGYSWLTRGKKATSLYWFISTTVFREELLNDIQEKTQINEFTLSI